MAYKLVSKLRRKRKSTPLLDKHVDVKQVRNRVDVVFFILDARNNNERLTLTKEVEARIATATRFWRGVAGIRIMIPEGLGKGSSSRIASGGPFADPDNPFHTYYNRLSCPGNLDMTKTAWGHFNTFMQQEGGLFSFRNGHRMLVIFVYPDGFFPGSGEDRVLGCTDVYRDPTINKFGIFIFLTRDAIHKSNPYLVAHEIGHALFINNAGQHPVPIHCNDPQNIMYKGVVPKRNPKIGPKQINRAKRGTLLY